MSEEVKMLNLEDYAGSSEFPVADTGDYEVVIFVERRSTKDGSKEFANLDFKIREDVDQAFGGVHIFDKAWPDKSNPSWFDLRKLGSILATQKGRPGYTNSFAEVDEFIQYINGAHMIVSVEKVYDDYSSKEVNNIKYLSYKPSVWDTQDHSIKTVESEPVEGNTAKLDLPNSELPF